VADRSHAGGRRWQMYISRMRPAQVAKSLPQTFATSHYRAAAGVAPSSASRALRDLAARGAIRRVGRGWWYRPTGEDDVPARLFDTPPGLWVPELECLLDALFGASVRRIGYLSGLDAAGIPLTSSLTVATTGRASARVGPAGLLHVRESEDTFGVGARRFTERTAVSEPERALLECAQFPRHAPRCEEYIGYAICWGGPAFAPDRVQALGIQLGWWAGMRRIASIAEGLAHSAPVSDIPVRPAITWAELAPRFRRGDRWINLNTRTSSLHTDEKRRVSWWTTPDALARQIAG
jgi:hypothetical protein